MDIIKKILKHLYLGWDMLIDIPLPNVNFNDVQVDDDTNHLTLLTFPFIGLILGLLIFIAFIILNTIMGPAVSIIFPIFLVLGLEFAVSWKNIILIVSLIENKILGDSIPTSLHNLKSQISTEKSSIGLSITPILLIFRALCFGVLLYNGYALWIIIVLIANFGTQTFLVNLHEIDSNEPFMNIQNKFFKIPPLTALIIIFLTSSCYGIIPAFLTTTTIILLAIYLRMYIMSTLNGVNGKIISITGYFIENITLIMGMICLLRK